ncbi:class Ib ribonucleoside-diphosphate reductase assembly flavoprotein NrdI [Clostridium sp. Sa3CUN1]|uniref:Class Ib ribonucleoside-diphosphate reductase assembly flavoprotein NrdI n=1 Tax=Clostridium gallinarum TaxID=2762246 RepID=A0ABR8Q071_9CLOT|nr:class Ib ribonucleoside-diphosphate reductase assembly flavoprotein NrdI [Clostridium gallinarum]MBD7913812.1 class Ib ribonucleoside-diphosphate reductase assembly flavoprotein NrdI [Clostridium gallinarum]
MLVVYDSRFGSGKAFAEKLGMTTQSVSEELNQECVLVTRNEGLGEISQATREFLDKHKDLVRGVVVNGSMARHAETYCFAADKIEKEYGIACIRKIDGQGNDEDVEAVKAAINNL